MSLNFSVNAIKDHQENYPDTVMDTWKADGSPTTTREWNPRTTQIVFGCMATGIGKITEGNADEWFARYTIWQQIHNLDVNLPFIHVVQHIGLSTNVFPQETRSQWLKRIVGGQMDDVKRSANYDRSHDNATYHGTFAIKAKIGEEQNAG